MARPGTRFTSQKLSNPLYGSCSTPLPTSPSSCLLCSLLYRFLGGLFSRNLLNGLLRSFLSRSFFGHCFCCDLLRGCLFRSLLWHRLFYSFFGGSLRRRLIGG